MLFISPDKRGTSTKFGDEGQASTIEYAILGLIIVSIIISGVAIYMMPSVPEDVAMKSDLEGLATQSDVNSLRDRISGLEEGQSAILEELGAETPARLSVTSINVPSQVRVGQTATVSAIVTNTGGQEGTKTIDFIVDGETMGSQDVTVGPGETKTVSFQITKDEEGTYNLSIGGASATLTVTAWSEEPVVIGQLGPNEINIGTSQIHAIRLAAEEINANGGILGRKIEVATRTTELDPNVGSSNFRRLVNQDKVDVVMGGFSSGVALSIQETMAELEQLWLGNAASPELTAKVANNYETYKYYFRISQNNGATMAEEIKQIVVDYLMEDQGLPVEDVAILRDDATWAEGVASVLRPPLEDAGINIVAEDPVPTGVTGAEFESLLASYEADGVDVVIPILAHVNGVPLVKKWADKKPNLLLVGHDLSMLNLKAWEITEGAAEYTIWIVDGGAVWSPVTDQTIPFIERYTERWDVPPESHEAFGFYDAVYMYKQAVEWAFDNGEEEPFDSDTLIPYLEKFNKDNPYEGVRGWNAFTQPGEDFVHELVWGDEYVRNWPIQWMGPQDQVMFWPPEVATGDIELPPWVDTAQW